MVRRYGTVLLLVLTVLMHTACTPPPPLQYAPARLQSMQHEDGGS